MAKFSGAVKLADLDDYIGPSQACIKPILKPKSDDDGKTAKNKGPTVEIALETNDFAMPVSHFDQIRTDQVKKTATVSLNDCLACSGCVTSAETVLITQQSSTDFFAHLVAGKRTFVVTISPHSRVALAHHFGLSHITTLKRLSAFFKSLGVKYVFDSAFTLDIALIEAAEEFVTRFRQGRVPVFSSECPGWICYAEKTQGPKVLDYISTTKSPQQIMGTLVKSVLADKLGLRPSDIYHATIMPCYDKKLEGSRNDFFNSTYETRDVDCVLATNEVMEMLEQRGVSLVDAPEAVLDMYSNLNSSQSEMYRSDELGASGGYLSYIFRYAAKALFDQTVEEVKLFPGRNPDFHEAQLEVDGKIVLRFAMAYGFRNIQNMMRKIKQNNFPYHYVEIMACPSGCLNGGGQLKHESRDPKAQKENIAALAHIYNEPSLRAPSCNSVVQHLYADVFGTPYSQKAQTLLHTQYHAVDKNDVNPLAIKW